MNIELKQVVATVESDIEESEEFPYGGFVAVASTPSVDRDGDKLESNEWITPLPDHITIDIDHEMSVRGTVGSARPYFSDDGQLMIEARFASTAQAQETRTLIREGHVRTVSVAFLTDKSKKSGEPRRELLNVGIVAIPSNREAMILSSKTAAIKDCQCWDGYERVPGTTPCAPGSCRKCDAASKMAALVTTKAGGDASLIQAIHDAACHLGAGCCAMDDPAEEAAEESAMKSVDAKAIPGDITIDEFKAALDSFFQTTPPDVSPVESPVEEAAVEPVEVSAPVLDAADDAADAVAQRARLMAMSVLADSVLASEN